MEDFFWYLIIGIFSLHDLFIVTFFFLYLFISIGLVFFLFAHIDDEQKQQKQ